MQTQSNQASIYLVLWQLNIKWKDWIHVVPKIGTNIFFQNLNFLVCFATSQNVRCGRSIEGPLPAVTILLTAVSIIQINFGQNEEKRDFHHCMYCIALYQFKRDWSSILDLQKVVSALTYQESDLFLMSFSWLKWSESQGIIFPLLVTNIITF